ncbi:homeodomain-like protein [Tanacetum coccineum]
MQVYWASVLVIPMGIVSDIQQLIRGFLWCNGDYKRGKAKVAWDDICLPKHEGGLGLRSLENLSCHTFWDICLKADMSWGWRKLLQLRYLVRPFFGCRLGMAIRRLYGMTCGVINALLVRMGLGDGLLRGLVKAPNLALIAAPNIDISRHDSMRWCDLNGNLSDFSVKYAWEVLRPRGQQVMWYHITWFSHCIPRHAFHIWLVMRRCLKTQDKLRPWDVDAQTDLTQLRCSLCGSQQDSHEHLFFECSYSSKVWNYIRNLAGMEQVPPVLIYGLSGSFRWTRQTFFLRMFVVNVYLQPLCIFMVERLNKVRLWPVTIDVWKFKPWLEVNVVFSYIPLSLSFRD